jgi:hypothetical protein
VCPADADDIVASLLRHGRSRACCQQGQGRQLWQYFELFFHMSSPSYTSFLVAGFLPAANTVQTHFFGVFSFWPGQTTLSYSTAFTRTGASVASGYLFPCFFSSKRTRVLFFFLHYASFRIV